MSSLDIKHAVKVLKEHRKKVTSSREKAMEFLARAGILTENSERLNPPYR